MKFLEIGKQLEVVACGDVEGRATGGFKENGPPHKDKGRDDGNDGQLHRGEDGFPLTFWGGLFIGASSGISPNVHSFPFVGQQPRLDGTDTG